MTKVFCIGNGTSRKDFNLNALVNKGKIYGCNAFYRDHGDIVDVLTAVDNGIMHEIYHSGFAYKKPCYFRNWSKLPIMMEEQTVQGLGDKADLEKLKDFDVVKKNNKENATEFVIHGTSLKGVVSIIQNARKKNPKATPDIIQKDINNSQIYISYIKEGDKSYDVKEVWDKYQDHGWACGATSAFVAIKLEKPKEMYLIGHDLVSNHGNLNNLYGSTKNYAPLSSSATPHVNWVNQWYTLMEWNPDIKFIKVNKTNDQKSNTEREIPEWHKYKGKNLEYISQAQLLDRISEK